jgi:SNF2 family DNA or RNA helicase
MKVSVEDAHEVVVSFSWHDFLGYIIEAYAVELDTQKEFTLCCQYVSPENADSFDIKDGYKEIIELAETIQPSKVFKKFNTNRSILDAESFFRRLKHPEKEADKLISDQIKRFVSRRRSEILNKLKGEYIYEFTKDRYPQKKKFYVDTEKASVLFHFKRNELGTNYFPTIRHRGKTLILHKTRNEILSEVPAWIWIGDVVVELSSEINAKKLSPFQKKNHVFVPKKLEFEFFSKFGMTLVESFEVEADGGLEMINFRPKLQTLLVVREVVFPKQSSLFDSQETSSDVYLTFELFYVYGEKTYAIDTSFQRNAEVILRPTPSGFEFEKTHRNPDVERETASFINSLGLDVMHGKNSKKFSEGIRWLSTYLAQLKEFGIEVSQKLTMGQITHLKPTLELRFEEKIDWFELNGTVMIGDHEISFAELVTAIKRKEKFLKVPGELLVLIPQDWIDKLEHLAELSKQERGSVQLKKHHLALVSQIENTSQFRIQNQNALKKLDIEEVEDCPLPKGFIGKLRPYQKKGFDWLVKLYRLGIGGCLADDMGLGKTIQCLALLQTVVNEHPRQASLVIMPTSLLHNWEREIKKFTPKLKYKIYAGSSRGKEENLLYDNNIILTTYTTARIDIEILEKIRFAYIILDESQTIKNPSSQTTIALRRLISNRKILLSGTPLQNSTLDLWTQMDFANHGILGNQNYFKNYFLNPIEKDGDMAKAGQLNAIIKPLILRRTKEQVAKDLPDKIEEVVYCDMSSAQSEYYDEVKNKVRSELLLGFQQFGVKKMSIKVIESLTRLRQIANHPKMVNPEYSEDSGKFDEVMSRIESVIAENHKVLVFSQFTKHLKLFTSELDQKNIPFCYLDGQTKNRLEVVDRFQKQQDCHLFFISLKAGGVGLNITAADYVFILDPWWNPAAEAQAIDRAHRIGQTQKVFVYRFISQETVEDKIKSLQEKKKVLANAIVQTDEGFMKGLSESDIEALL